MSLGDFRVVDRGTVLARRYQTKAGQTAIVAGEFVLQDTAGDVEYVEVAPDGADNSRVWVGVSATADTVTAGADGEVFVFDDVDYVFRGKPTTPANLATTIILTQVTLDVVASLQTVDENDTSNGTLIIQNFDSDNETIDVKMAVLDHITEG